MQMGLSLKSFVVATGIVLELSLAGWNDDMPRRLSLKGFVVEADIVLNLSLSGTIVKRVVEGDGDKTRWISFRCYADLHELES